MRTSKNALRLVFAAAATGALIAGCAVANRVDDGASYRPALKDIIFYSDLGPNSVDVSLYPDKQKENYAVYARTCSQCHSLARSINAPTVSRGFWEFYMLGMRVRSRFTPGTEITREESRAIADFLEFDSKARKVERKEEFDALTESLKRGFDKTLEERIRRLQEQSQPKLLPPQP